MFIVAALYHFTRFDTPAALRGPLLSLMQTHQVTGTLLLAHEGINGTIAGSRAGIDAVLAHVRGLPGSGMERKHRQPTAIPALQGKAEARNRNYGPTRCRP
jgi:UPF0176 protein